MPVEPLGPMTDAGRGLKLIEFKDKYGKGCSLQQSSLAEDQEYGRSAVWLGCNENHPPHLGREMSPRMHLDRKQVRALVKHLRRWLKDNTFEFEAATTPKETA